MILAPLAAAAFNALVILVFAWLYVDGLWRPDGFDYAQIGRELLRGHGFGSQQAIYALHLEFLTERDLLTETWPNLHRFPLPSLVLAGWFRLLGEGPVAVVAYGVLFHAATSALLFVWARAALGVAPAIAAVLLFTLNGAMLESACSGLSEPPVVFFFTLALFATWQGLRRGGPASWLLAGAALGLASLARTNALLAAPVLGAALMASALRGENRAIARGENLANARGASRAKARGALLCAGLFSLGLLAPLAPWMLRNLEVAGSPFFSLHTYFLLPSGTGPLWEKWDLTVPWVREFVSPLDFARAHAGLVLAKWWRHAFALLLALPTLAGTFLVFPAAFAALVVPLRARLQPVAWLVFAAFALNAVFVSLTDFFFDKYHFHFLPVAILLAVGVLRWGLSGLDSGRLRGVAFALLVLAMANLPAVFEAFREVPLRASRIERGHFDFLREHTAPGDVILSDQSYAVAWEADRRSVRLHYDRLADGTVVLGALAISDDYLPLAGVYLSRMFLADPARQQILRDTLKRVPRFTAEFPEIHRFPEGGLYLSR